MSRDRIYVRGELHISLEEVAAIYTVDVLWLREVVDASLLAEGVETTPTACIAAVQLDRVATLVRLHRALGLDVEALRLAMDGPDPGR